MSTAKLNISAHQALPYWQIKESVFLDASITDAVIHKSYLSERAKIEI